MRKLLFLVIAITLLASGNEAYSQINRRNIKKNNRRISSFKGKKSKFGKEKRYNAIGFTLSALNYYGDLAPRPSRVSTDISFTRPALGISLTHRFGPRYSLTGSFMYGTLKGSDAESANVNDLNGISRHNRNLSFRNHIKEFSVVATFDLFENQSTYISRVMWTPYVSLGLVGFFHNPQGKAPATDLNGNPLPQAGKWVNLQPLGTEGEYAGVGVKPYHKFQPAIPFALGARFRVNEVMDFSAELGFRYTFTDYLDDVSKNYADLSVFKNNELAKAMAYRSNELPEVKNGDVALNYDTGIGLFPGYGKSGDIRGHRNNRDIYMVTTFRLTYILGKNFHRAKFR